MFHSRNKVSCIYVLQTNEIKTFMEVSKQLLNFHFFLGELSLQDYTHKSQLFEIHAIWCNTTKDCSSVST